MIGFDLVCLLSSTFSSHRRMLRYAEKILTPAEGKTWESDGACPEGLWSYWALKESAYKIESRATGLHQLCPKRFEVRQNTDSSFLVISPLQTYHGFIQRSEATLFAVTGPTDHFLSATKTEVFPLSSSQSTIQSAEVREHLGKKFPHLSPENQDTNSTFLSISHHGLWGGYAVYQQSVL